MPVRGAGFLARPLSPSPLAADSLSRRCCLHCLGRSRDAVLARAFYYRPRCHTRRGPDPRTLATTTLRHFSPSSPFIVFSFLATRSFFRPHAHEHRRGEFGVYVSDRSFSAANRTRQEREGADYDRRSKGGRGKRNEQTPRYESCRREICAKSEATAKKEKKRKNAARHDGFIIASLSSLKKKLVIIK